MKIIEKLLTTTAVAVTALAMFSAIPAMADRGGGDDDGNCCDGGDTPDTPSNGGSDNDFTCRAPEGKEIINLYKGGSIIEVITTGKPNPEYRVSDIVANTREGQIQESIKECGPKTVAPIVVTPEPVVPTRPRVEIPTPAPYVAPVVPVTYEFLIARGEECSGEGLAAFEAAAAVQLQEARNSTPADFNGVRAVISETDISGITFPTDFGSEQYHPCDTLHVVKISGSEDGKYTGTASCEFQTVGNTTELWNRETGSLHEWLMDPNKGSADCPSFTELQTPTTAMPETCPAPEVAPAMTAVPTGILTPEFIAVCVASPEVKVEILREALAAGSSAPAQCPAP